MNETYCISKNNIVCYGYTKHDCDYGLLILEDNYIIKSKKELEYEDKFFKNNKWVSW